MTELTGGSDVGLSETVAKQEDGVFRLYGRKWFTSAIASQMALTLARPEGNPPGGRGLALFYLETRDEQGRPRNIQINRLKDKLGTRKVPTAELTLDGTPAQLVKGSTDGVRNIAPLLNITRLLGSYVPAAGLAITPSRPAPSKRRNQSCAMLNSRVAGVTCIGGAADESSDSNIARRSWKATPRKSWSPSARTSKNTIDAGISCESSFTRDAAG